MERAHGVGRLLVPLAWVNAVLHLLGLAAAALFMAPGTPLASPAERTAYLATHPRGWSAGWALWMLCAVALVTFMAALRQRPRAGSVETIALVFATAAMAVDLLCDTLLITVLPHLAQAGPDLLFLAAERGLGAGGTVVANGLYTASVLVLLLGFREAPAHVKGLGGLTVAAGTGMVVAGFLGDARLLAAVTGPTILGYCGWSITFARWLERRPGP